MEVIGYGLEWAGIITHHSINKMVLESILDTYYKNIEKQYI